MEAAHCRISGPACRGSLLFPLSSLSSCALQRWGKPVREYRRDFPRAAHSLPARCTRSLPFPSRARIAPCFPPARARRRPFFPSARTRLSFGRSPWRPRRRLGDAFPREATPYAGKAWRAGRLNREVAWTPWRRLGDAVKTMILLLFFIMVNVANLDAN